MIGAKIGCKYSNPDHHVAIKTYFYSMLKRLLPFFFTFLFIHQAQADDIFNFNIIEMRIGICTAGANASLLKSQGMRSGSMPSQKLDWPGLGFSAGVMTDTRWITNFTSFGLEISYLNTKASFHSDDFMASIPELIHYLKHDITLHQIELPVYLKLRLGKDRKKFYGFGGVGLTYIFSGKRNVEQIYFNMNNPGNKMVTPVYDERFAFENNKKLGKFFVFAIGKSFPVGKLSSLSTEIRYMQDIKNRNYEIKFIGITQLIPVGLKTLSLRLIYDF